MARREKKRIVDEDLTSLGRPESIMQDTMLSIPPRLLERREKRMKKNEDPPTSRGRPEIIMQDMMLSGPPRLLFIFNQI